MAWYNKGNALYVLKRSNEALIAYEQALTLDPRFTDAQINKGLVLHDLKQYKEALAAFEEALALNPRLAFAWINKGLVLHDLKQYEKALSDYEQALPWIPDMPLPRTRSSSAQTARADYRGPRSRTPAG